MASAPQNNAMLGSKYLLNMEDPSVQAAKTFIFYGLSGAPPTKAHRNILDIITKIFPGPDNMVILVPTSNLYNKESVKCTLGYTYRGSDLRIELHKKMVELLQKDNIRISLHEQEAVGGMGTYDSIHNLRSISLKNILMIWGQDSLEGIFKRKWKNSEGLLKMIDDGEITAVYIPRGADPLNYGEPPISESIVGKIKNISEIIRDIPPEKQPEIIDALQTSEGVSSTAARKSIREHGNIKDQLDPEIIEIISNYDGKDEANPKPMPYSAVECETGQKGGKRYRKSKNKKSKSKKLTKKRRYYN